MGALRYIGLSLTHDTQGAGGLWDRDFYTATPWPRLALIQDYDAQVGRDRNGKRIIRMSMTNGRATYEVVRKDRYGAYECKLRRGSTYKPMPKRLVRC